MQTQIKQTGEILLGHTRTLCVFMSVSTLSFSQKFMHIPTPQHARLFAHITLRAIMRLGSSVVNHGYLEQDASSHHLQKETAHAHRMHDLAGSGGRLAAAT